MLARHLSSMDQQQQYIPKRKDLVHRREDEAAIATTTWVVIAAQDTGETHHGQRIWVWIQEAEKAGVGPGEIVPSHELIPIDY